MNTTIELKPFKIDDWEHLQKWIKNERELIQFAGPVFSFPIDRQQVKNFLEDPKRIVFKICYDNHQTIGIAEISSEKEDTAKLARILIGEISMRGKGIGTELINKLTDYAFEKLQKSRIILNIYSWNIRAIKCYEKAGYLKTGKPPIKTTVGDEYWESIEMEKVK